MPKRKGWGNLDLNQGPTGYESVALTAELLPPKALMILPFLIFYFQAFLATLMDKMKRYKNLAPFLHLQPTVNCPDCNFIFYSYFILV